MSKIITVITVALMLAVTVGVAQDKSALTEEPHMDELGKNVRLEFAMVPEDGDDEPAFVVTAVSRFGTRISYKGDTERFELSANGKVGIKEDGKILVLMDVDMEYENENSGDEAEFSATCSALLTAGQPKKVASMGEKLLMVTATYPDDTKKK